MRQTMTAHRVNSSVPWFATKPHQRQAAKFRQVLFAFLRHFASLRFKSILSVSCMGWLSIIVDPTGAMIGLWQTMSNKPVRKNAKG
jgi:hypothetical protein